MLLGSLILRNEIHHSQAEGQLREQYSQEVAQMKREAQAVVLLGWAPNRPIASGQKISASDLVQVELPKDSVPANYVASKEQIEGKTAKVGLDANTLITGSLLYEEEPMSGDLRNREMSFVQLPMSLEKGDSVDIRIQFPTGEDYILLSKKKVNALARPTMSLTLNEQELLLLSSAIVDAYLHKASIYALTYVEPGIQDKAIPTYPANGQVMKLLSRDPNIVSKAEKYLKSESSRELLEKSLNAVSEQNALTFASSQAEAAASAATQLELEGQSTVTSEEQSAESLTGK